jgi:hypothetical protein
MSIPRTMQSKKYPPIIRNHLIFKAYPGKIQKIFPKIGLKNSNANVETKQLELHKLDVYIASIRKSFEDLAAIIEGCYLSDSALPIKEQLVPFFRDLSSSLKIESNGKISLITTKEIRLECINKTFPINTNVFDLYESVRELVRRFTSNFNKFTEEVFDGIFNFPKEDLKIVFASDGNKGPWDIATMSMRGVSSCQKWKHKLAVSLVGTIVDPCAGIIYLTDGSNTKYGDKIIKRAIVRYTVNKSGKPHILIERIYPFDYITRYFDSATFDVFSNFIKEKTKNKFNVLYGEKDSIKSLYVPTSKMVSSLDECYLSYRDSGVIYKTDKKIIL